VLIEKNKSFIEKLEIELQKIHETIKEEEVLEYVMSDIRKYLLDDKGDCIANQGIIG